MLKKIFKLFQPNTNIEHSIAISLAKNILESKDPLQSFILCKGINNSKNRTNIAISTKAAMGTIFARGD